MKEYVLKKSQFFFNAEKLFSTHNFMIESLEIFELFTNLIGFLHCKTYKN